MDVYKLIQNKFYIQEKITVTAIKYKNKFCAQPLLSSLYINTFSQNLIYYPILQVIFSVPYKSIFATWIMANVHVTRSIICINIWNILKINNGDLQVAKTNSGGASMPCGSTRMH
jgi:hypothetical protein